MTPTTATPVPFVSDLAHPVAWAMRRTLAELLPKVMLLSCEVADDPEADSMRVRMRLGPRETTALTPGAPEAAPSLAEFTLTGQAQMTDGEWKRFLRYEMRLWFKDAARLRGGAGVGGRA